MLAKKTKHILGLVMVSLGLFTQAHAQSSVESSPKDVFFTRPAIKITLEGRIQQENMITTRFLTLGQAEYQWGSKWSNRQGVALGNFQWVSQDNSQGFSNSWKSSATYRACWHAFQDKQVQLFVAAAVQAQTDFFWFESETNTVFSQQNHILGLGLLAEPGIVWILDPLFLEFRMPWMLAELSYNYQMWENPTLPIDQQRTAYWNLEGLPLFPLRAQLSIGILL